MSAILRFPDAHLGVPNATAEALAEQRAETAVQRDARLHTLRDPVAYKLHDLGRHFITGRYSDPTPYS
jgi:hypothetical protein